MAVVEIASSAFQNAVVVYSNAISSIFQLDENDRELVLCVESRTRFHCIVIESASVDKARGRKN